MAAPAREPIYAAGEWEIDLAHRELRLRPQCRMAQARGGKPPICGTAQTSSLTQTTSKVSGRRVRSAFIFEQRAGGELLADDMRDAQDALLAAL